MQLQLAQCQKELRERDEFPIILPTLATRARTAKKTIELREKSPVPITEGDTSIGPSEWDDASGITMDRQQVPKRKEKEINKDMGDMDVETVGYSTTENKEREEEGRKGRSAGEGGVPPMGPPPPPITPPPSQSLRKRKDREKRNKREDMEKKLEWLMEEVIKLGRDIRGENMNSSPITRKERTTQKREEEKDKEYPPLRSREAETGKKIQIAQ